MEVSEKEMFQAMLDKAEKTATATATANEKEKKQIDECHNDNKKEEVSE